MSSWTKMYSLSGRGLRVRDPMHLPEGFTNVLDDLRALRQALQVRGARMLPVPELLQKTRRVRPETIERIFFIVEWHRYLLMRGLSESWWRLSTNLRVRSESRRISPYARCVFQAF